MQDVAWLEVLPSVRNFGATLSRDLGKQMPTAGAQSGLAWSQGFSTGASKGMTTATTSMGLMARAGAGVNTAFQRIQSSWAKVAAGFYATRTVFNFLGSTVGAARDLNEEINKSTVVFAGSARQVLDWSKSTGKSLGISQQQALASAGTFGNLFRAMGLVPAVSATMSTKLVQLSSDLASFNNANPADVLEAMRAGLVGEMEPMRRYGVDLSDVRLKQEALNLGIYNGKGILNGSQKAQAAYSLMLKQTSLAQGDFQRTSGGLANQQRILSAEWTNAKATLGQQLLPVMLDLVHLLTGSVIPAFGATVGFIRQNIIWLGPLAGALIGVVTAFKLVAGAVRIFDLAWKASTFGLIIVAVVAVGVALYELWTRSQTFRQIVIASFQAVAAAGQWMWEKVLRPTFSALQTAWTATSTGVLWAWTNVLHPAWVAVASVATWLWANILRPVFAAVSLAWTVMANVIGAVWANTLHPLWTFISAVAKALFQVAVVAIFLAVRVAWEVMSHGIAAIWNTVLHPVWVAVSTVAGWLWRTILAPIFSAIGAGWSGLATGMRWVYDRVLAPLWSVFTTAIGAVRRAFEVVVAGIRTAWDTLGGIAAKPVNFVIEYVFNRGLFAAWNWLVDKLGLPFGHAHFNQIQMAAGGRVGGRSPSKRADNIPIWATAGEFMQPVDAVSFYGADTMEAMRSRRIPRAALRALARLGTGGRVQGLAGGGLATATTDGGSTGGGSSPWSAITGWIGHAWNSVTDVLGRITGSITGPLRDLVARFGNSPFVQAIAAVPKRMASLMWDAVKGAVGNVFAGGSENFGVGGVGGYRDIGRQIAASMGFGSQFGAIDYIFTRESGWNPMAQNPVSTAFGIPQFLAGTRAQYAGNWSSPAFQIKSGIQYMVDRYGSPNQAAAFWKANHWYGRGGPVRASVFDDGGTVAPGLNLIYNGTGGGEVARILTPPQDAAYRQLGLTGNGHGGGTVVGSQYNGDVYLVDLAEQERARRRDLRRALAGAGVL